MDCERSGAGCFSFLPRRISKKKKTLHAPSDERDDVSESAGSCDYEAPQASGLKNGTLDTYASWRIERRQSRGERSRPPSEKLVMMPYFGNFAGQWLSFDLKRCDSLVSIRVKVQDQALTTIYHRNAPRPRAREEDYVSTLRDRCLKFAHEIKQSSDQQNLRRCPPSLAFLTEQTVLTYLDELPVSQLPAHRYTGLFPPQTQTVTIRVWPRRFGDSFRIKVKPCMSIMEIQWMLCRRLGLSNPTCLSVYLKDSLESLSPNSPLQPHHVELECVILPKVLQSKTEWQEEGKSLPVTVSVIGHGIEDVKVHPSMTLCEFEHAIKTAFGLNERSFLYMPQVFRSRKSSQCGLAMATLLNDSTTSLISSSHRHFPAVVGVPSLKIKDSYKQLPLYQMAISELDLLKTSPLIVFEVSGPTVPLAFKTVQAQDYTEDLSSFNTRDSVFALVSVKPHIVSVNPDWTMETLLKFIESISGFPCVYVKIGSKVLHNTETVNTHFVKPWLLPRGGHVKLRYSIPEVAAL